jgi:aminopeptidase N
VIEAYQQVLNDQNLDMALRAEALLLPSENELAEATEAADPDAIFAVREQMLSSLAKSLRIDFEILYKQLSDNQAIYQIEHHEIGKRALKNCCLAYLAYINDEACHDMIYQQFSQANNMTDQLAALSALSHLDNVQHDQAMQEFQQQWQNNNLVMDKWFVASATSRREDTLETVKQLMQHPAFDLRNPNKVRALISAFALANPVRFHKKSGEGYQFIADQVIELDHLNPQIASRLVRSLMNWKHYEPSRSNKMQQQLKRIAAIDHLSNDVMEIVAKSLTD